MSLTLTLYNDYLGMVKSNTSNPISDLYYISKFSDSIASINNSTCTYWNMISDYGFSYLTHKLAKADGNGANSTSSV